MDRRTRCQECALWICCSETPGEHSYVNLTKKKLLIMNDYVSPQKNNYACSTEAFGEDNSCTEVFISLLFSPGWELL